MSAAIEIVENAIQKGMNLRPQIGGFPYLAEALREAGVTLNEWILPSCQSLYQTNKGSVIFPNPPLITTATDIPTFNQDLLIHALRADQTGQTTFPEFLQAIWAAGVIRYTVNLEARHVIYYGSLGESYTEAYPAVTLPI
ncbi:DUF1398 family protein [Acinetobacter sp. ANC 4178]|jgi:uncharacterized protein YbcV (DUF1398 family)|uniref:DUF1398 family protein n=1 Tax=Acinetobacter sp. ANC 4178 TaxID=2529839 RepID=UPI00103A6EFA|nr:DUF1398 family protein [Acinetobacter sp. ANC 4178]TCB68605.1 DUF1398 domain-containing protein [Acinetobacter sp. ANC 4178]